MKRLIFVLPLLVFSLCRLSPVMGALPFGPGSQNGNAAYHKIHADSIWVEGSLLLGAQSGTPVDLSAAISDTADAVRSLVGGKLDKTAARDSVNAAIKAALSPWMVDVPTYPDSVGTALDSLTVMLMADMTLDTEYSHYLHAIGNGTAPEDSLRILRSFKPVITDPDSLYWWVKANAAGDSVNYSVIIRGKNAAGVMDSCVATVVLTAAAMDAWCRVAVAAGSFVQGWYDAIVRVRISHAAYFDISPLYFK